MDAKKDFRHLLLVATLTTAAGVFSGSTLAMPPLASIDAVGRSSDWMLRHGLGAAPKVVVGRDVNAVSGRASNDAWRASRTGAGMQSITVESRNIRTLGRA
jgi:hypothetical protein